MFTCSQCGYSSGTKLGKCPSCNEFGSFIKDESKESTQKKGNKHGISTGSTLTNDTSRQQSNFWKVQDPEFVRVLQEGVKEGGVYLLAGEPGIGKSTLILQIINDILTNNKVSIAYFSGEENEGQIAKRYQRLFDKDSLDIHVYHATHFEDIIATTTHHKYDMIIVDSIQTVYSPHNDSPAGSPNQVRYTSEKISEFCKKNNITSFIIGHVTKDGEIAGPKYLEHIVDVVLYLEGDRFGQLRFLRSKKNRFGHTDDSAILEMTTNGLKGVDDLKERIMKNAHLDIAGNVLTIGLDNGRPVIANVEVLLTKTNGKFLTRNCVGVNPKRVDMIIAILQKYLDLKLYLYDIYINIPGEFTFLDSGLDLAIGIAILSQYHDKVVNKDTIFVGELGLSGQVVKTKFHQKRLRELPEGFSLIDYQSMKFVRDLGQYL